MKLYSLAILALATPGLATDKAPQDAPDVVIEAPQADLAHRAVAVFAQPPHQEQIARWARPLRVHVYYAPRAASDFLCQRLKAVASTIELKVTPSDHDPNVVIVFTGSSSAFTARLLKAHPGLYRDVDRIGFPTKDERKALLEDRPVRWFEVRQQQLAHSSGDLTLSKVTRNAGYSTRLAEPTVFRKDISYVIVDAELVRSVSWQQLADYLAMVVLTEPGLSGGTTAPNQSILSIFSPNNPDKPQELTALDRSVLKSFYSYDETQRGFAQRAGLEHGVAKAVAGRPK